MPQPGPIDLSLANLPDGRVSWEYTSAEHPDDRALRLSTLDRQTRIADYQNVAVFVVMLAAVTFLGGMAAYAAFVPGAADDGERKWALALLSALFSGSLGFVVGRKIGNTQA